MCVYVMYLCPFSAPNNTRDMQNGHPNIFPHSMPRANVALSSPLFAGYEIHEEQIGIAGTPYEVVKDEGGPSGMTKLHRYGGDVSAFQLIFSRI